MPKVFTYKGHTLEELQRMSTEEFARIAPSRVRRALRKGLTEVQRKLLREVEKEREKLAKGEKPKLIKTHCRDMPILPCMVGLEFGVHNGKEFVKVEVVPEMIGHRLGEFSLTRKPVKHGAPGIGATRGSMFVSIK